MKIIPEWYSNIKYWRIFNRLMFGRYLTCPKCQHIEMKENYQGRYLWCKHCRSKHRYSATRGTFLYGCKLQPIQLYQLLWCFLGKRSIEEMRDITGLSYVSIDRWLERFRRNIPYNAQDEPKLEGVIKVDESYFGKRRSKQPQLIVVGALNADTGAIRLAIIPNREEEILEDFIERNIEKGSIIISDSWTGYINLRYLGYDHYPFNHSKGEYTHTNQMESLWAEIKKYMQRTQGNILTSRLEIILNEWMARRNKPEWFKNPEKFLQRVLQR